MSDTSEDRAVIWRLRAELTAEGGLIYREIERRGLPERETAKPTKTAAG